MFKQLLKSSLTLAIIIAAVMSGRAMAFQFSFNVPVELKDIDPKYPYVMIKCKVHGAVSEIGRYGSIITLKARGFSGILSVPVSPVAGKSVVDGKYYFCDAFYCTANNDSSCLGVGVVPHQPGTTFTPGVKGPIQ